jgi:hypothetical protein
VHHLYPTAVAANEVRANYPLGDVTGSTSWSDGGSALGSGSGGTVFEPRDAHKGNAARSMLYVWIQYGYAPSSSQLSMYGSWSALDPVTARDQEQTLPPRATSSTTIPLWPVQPSWSACSTKAEDGATHRSHPQIVSSSRS